MTELEKAKVARQIAAEAADEALQRIVAAKRAHYLQYLNKNLAGTRKRRRGWSTPAAAERDFSNVDRERALSMARQKVEESPFVHGLFQTRTDNVVGSGFTIRPRTGDRELDKEIRDRWQYASLAFDIRGIRSLGGLQRCWYFRRGIDGDVGVNLLDGGTNTRGETISRLQTIEGHRIRKKLNDPRDCGIDYNRYGRPTAFHVVDGRKRKDGRQDQRQKPQRIPASQFVFYPNFPHERAERKRGVSQLLQNLALLEDVEEIIENMVQKVKNEAFVALKFKMELPESGQLFGTELQDERTAEDGKKRQHVRMVSGMNINCDPNEDVELLGSQSPHGDFVPFLRFLLRYGGTSFGVPLEILLLDFQDTNFTGGRMLVELAKKRWRVEQQDLGMISSRVYLWWLSRERKHNGLKVKDDLIQARSFWRHSWGMPGWPYLDPLKEGNARGIMLDRGLTSHQRILDEIGDDDFDDIATELEREYEVLNDKKIPIISGLPGANVINEELIRQSVQSD